MAIYNVDIVSGRLYREEDFPYGIEDVMLVLDLPDSITLRAEDLAGKSTLLEVLQQYVVGEVTRE